MLQRAKEYLAKIPGGVGAYSESKGAVVLRQHVAKVGLKLDSWGGGESKGIGVQVGPPGSIEDLCGLLAEHSKLCATRHIPCRALRSGTGTRAALRTCGSPTAPRPRCTS